ncbi:MAG: methyltransferase domain-containing protein [Acidimicrobiia bacterium]|nr:methyltransferase domain-containing protein [Acidimicrobiia bacterium]
MSARSRFAAIAMLLVCVGLDPIRGAQLGGRSAEEWIKTLESPNRIQGLKIDETVQHLKLKRGDVVADLGAGSGLFEPPLAEAVGRSGLVYAVDIDQGLIDAINRKIAEKTLTNVKAVLGQFTDPQLPRASLDVAFINDVLHHIEDRTTYLTNVAKALKPSGRIALIDFHPEQGGHRNQPELQVSKSAAEQLMAGIDFKPVEEIPLFTEKYYVLYQRR